MASAMTVAGTGIVAAVDPDFGARLGACHQVPSLQLLHAAGPGDRWPSPFRRHRFGDDEAGGLDGGDGGGRIGELVAAGQARRRQVEQGRPRPDRPAGRFRSMGDKILADEGRALSRSAVAISTSSAMSFPAADHDGRPRLMMPAFSAAISSSGIAEIGLVVDRDRHDHRDGGLVDDVGGVEAPAKADLDERTSAGWSANRT
jgi:hypothetical protein